MNPLPYLTAVVCSLKSLQIAGATHVPAEGPALLACAHDSPLDLFYLLAMMRLAGRQDHRFVMAAELVDAERFRPYTRDAIALTVPRAALLAGALARMGSWIVPRLLRGLHPIPIYRQGDDSASRTESLTHLLAGGLVAMAPGWGDDRHRGADGQRPLTHGVAAVARRFFDATGEPLAVIPVGLMKPRDGRRPRTYVRVGAPLRAMSNREYPALFSACGQENPTVKHQAYQHFTQQLAGRLAELSSG
jgi:1-acyl-sn-glycerol-3-phosphate acyltransferase